MFQMLQMLTHHNVTLLSLLADRI